MHVSSNLATEDRLTWIRTELDSSGRVGIAVAAKQLGVSEMTIRRDLQELEAMGSARRVRGGAVAVGPVALVDRKRQRARAKAAISAKLVKMLPQSGAVALDASSTILRLASHAAPVRDLTVVTNSVETFHALQGKPGFLPTLTGGSLEPRTGSLVGPIACRSAAQFLTTRFFLSSAALSVEVGASEACIEEAEVKRVFAASAAEVVLAVDASKLGAPAVALGLEWDQIDVLVTELDPSDPRLTPYRSLADIC